jgi:hypothetical protein
MSLQSSDAEAAGHAVAPRVSLADIEAAIETRYDTNGYDAVVEQGGSRETFDKLRLLSLCLLVMKNGFIIVGKSAPASPENFNAELGRKLAYEDAVRQIWPLMGFALKDRLAERCVPRF